MTFRTKYSQWLLLFISFLFVESVFSHGMSDAEKQIIIEGGNLRYIWIGATHMLSGYDHLAFIFGVIFFLTCVKDIVKYISAFTLGHSITLIYATFTAVQVNYFLIDAVIALSVCYIAFSNLNGFDKYLNIKAPNMLAMIFSLGLIHGLGLSTRLQQLPLSEDHLLLNIISFNLGIELGQIFALVLMLFFIARFRKSERFSGFTKISNIFLIVLGTYLFLMQMHGYEHATNNELITETSKTESPHKQSKNIIDEWNDVITVVIPARGEKEYKLLLEKGGLFKYQWETNGEKLFYDFHGEPTGDVSGYFKSFQKYTNNFARGKLIAEFNGTHGWYWKNNTASDVEITLKVDGDYQRLDNKNSVPKKHESIF